MLGSQVSCLGSEVSYLGSKVSGLGSKVSCPAFEGSSQGLGTALGSTLGSEGPGSKGGAELGLRVPPWGVWKVWGI
eukprot:1068129-Amorphochlora_amoeboformis.AAC.1